MANRRVYLLKALARKSFSQQVAENVLDLAGTTDHADVASGGFQGGAQGIFIEVMAARDDDNPAGLVGFQFANSLGDIAEGELYLIAEHVRVGQVAPVIDDDDAVIKLGCQASQGLRDISCSGDDEARFGVQYFDEQFERGPATAHGLVRVKVNVSDARFALLQGLQGALGNLHINFGTGEAAAGSTVGAHQHFGANAAGSRADGFDDGGDCYPLALLQSCLYFAVDGCGIHSSILCFLPVLSR